MDKNCDINHQPHTHVSFFNSPQFFWGLLGHSGLIVEALDATCHLYSFHPAPNNGEPFGPGSIAQIVHPSDGRNLDSFIRACLTPHGDDGRRDSRGILLANGTTHWYERIRRLVRMEVTEAQAVAIEAFARKTAENPPKFNVLTYSCEHFVDDALGAGGIELRSDHRSLRRALIPNAVYHGVTAATTGIFGLQKIDFNQEPVFETASVAEAV